MPHPRLLRASPLVAIALLAGCLAPASPEGAAGDEAGPEGRPFELWLTDAPADITSLHVSIARATIGGKPLELVAPRFDLLAHRGPDQALLVAQGFRPPGAADEVRVDFASATAVIGGREVELPASSLAWSAPAGQPNAAVLLDIDVPASLVPEGNGYRFRPVVLKAYTTPDSQGTLGAATPGRDAVGHASAPAAQAAWQDVPAVVAAAAGAAPGLPDPADVQQAVEDAASMAGDAAALVDAAAGHVPGAAAVASTAHAAAQEVLRQGYIVRFGDDPADEMTATDLARLGATLVVRFTAIPAAYVLATPEAAEALRALPNIAHVEEDTPIELDDAQSRAAVRATSVQHPVTGLRDAQGRPIDGRGVGVAVVDTGIDGTHPDLQHASLQPAAPLARNLKLVERVWVDVPATDTTSGHGTHVASIVAGRGVADPAQVGVAPGATLYGLGIGEAPRLLWAAQALDWVLANHATAQPPIRVVQNSWSTTNGYDPDAIVNVLVNRLVGEGVVVVFSAGNAGGDGSAALTSGYCRNPTPGVVCVAAYDDQGTGTRQGTIAPYSSRGKVGSPQTWPDISAPGTAVRASRPLVGWSTGIAFPDTYVELSGTSQAAPHVSGVVALMLQANPSLGPAAVEQMLKSTAHKFADGGSYASSGSHHAKGHGLVDAQPAVEAALGGAR